MKKHWIPVTLLLALGVAAGCASKEGMMDEGMTHESLSDGGMMKSEMSDEVMMGEGMDKEGM